ncbi:TetR/AcrR family transcriptional regulator [Gordonia sp. TBRC 11910]|uniref:TetR/AcrR family transcriptional regulator n=1 Tax=Gordonia asplenii TaxID=2725283 RepID=A0A848L5P2_9ACTN|nr:TetR/AcrR family transcriptional regulator [Gordonia asplenii]NMO03871.1 TetR/AcrR family transcriptional regulator [Gordonia asplenii]
MTAPDWIGGRAELAANRILDVAEQLFVSDGVGAVTMRQVAGVAGCSRATLYRYFPSREALHAAYVERASGQVARAVIAAVGDADDPILVGITTALAGVRANPALSAWFTPDVAGTATDLALLSPTIERIVVQFLRGSSSSPDDSAALRAQWLVRVIVSLLARPAESPQVEEQLLRRFVLPVI